MGVPHMKIDLTSLRECSVTEYALFKKSMGLKMFIQMALIIERLRTSFISAFVSSLL